MKVLGLISGTSHDGIDAAVVEFEGHGDHLVGTLRHGSVTPYSVELRARLAAALPPAATSVAEICRLDTHIGQEFAAVAVAVSDEVGGLDLVVSHGQTVFHWVDSTHALGTLQLGQAAWIAERTGVAVVSDVRSRDITAGGHGAPLVSILDTMLLASRGGRVAALNLGGISNMTVVDPPADPSAFDIGPANALIDSVIADTGINDRGFDVDGLVAASGTVDHDVLHAFLDDDYYALPTPKSTGKEHFNGDYVRAVLGRTGRVLPPADLVATLTELTVRTVAQAVTEASIETVVASGGGCRNPVMMAGLRRALDVPVIPSDDLGAPADVKEAMAFALIGWCTVHGLPGNEPAATGAGGRRILGTITPGANPLVLPPPHTTPVRSLELRDATPPPPVSDAPAAGT
ncbi:anhydro-N-acetylmuramic acid kinase [soil metagenome]